MIGFVLTSRKIDESWIAHAAPVVREVWGYLYRQANHKDVKYSGFEVRRGQLFRSVSDIRSALHWYVGYRKNTYSENQTKHALKLLRREGMIQLTSQPRGNLITIVNYSKYQDRKFHESTDESTSESTNDQPMINRSSLPINNNENNETINTSSKDDDGVPPSKEKKYGNEEISKMISFLIEVTKADDFTESKKQQRFWSKHLCSLMEKIGRENFAERLNSILADDFKRKNCGSMAYIYRQIKGFINPERIISTAMPRVERDEVGTAIY